MELREKKPAELRPVDDNPAVRQFEAATDEVDRLKAALQDAYNRQALAAAKLPTEGDHRGTTGRVSRYLGEKETAVNAMKLRAKKLLGKQTP